MEYLENHRHMWDSFNYTVVVIAPLIWCPWFRRCFATVNKLPSSSVARLSKYL